jgi:hypothetical protein
MTNFDNLNFVTPSVNQGQIVTISYAADWENGQIVSRSFDASDRTGSYAVTPASNLVGEFDPINEEPSFRDDGLWTAVD